MKLISLFLVILTNKFQRTYFRNLIWILPISRTISITTYTAIHTRQVLIYRILIPHQQTFIFILMNAAIPQTQQWEDIEPTATNTRFTINSSEEAQWELAKGEIQHFRNLQFRSYFLESNVMKMIRILVFISTIV